MAVQEVISSSKKLCEILHLSSFGSTELSIGIRLGLTKNDLDFCFDYLLKNKLIEISDSKSESMIYITGRGMQVLKRITRIF
jgi:hypothetical protein